MIDLKPYYQVKLTLCRCMSSFLNNPPKTEDEKYAYDIIQKAYLINEKKIEMLDFQKKTRLKRVFFFCPRQKWCGMGVNLTTFAL